MTEINRYHNGKIYTIRSHQTDKYYIGSTCSPLYKRLHEHKLNKNKYENKNKEYLTSYEILKYDDYYIELLENFKCETKDELFKREGELMRLHKDNIVNKFIAGRTKKQHYQDNKIKRLKQVKEYAKDNKDKIKDYIKQYTIDNKDKLDIIRNEKIECECGGNYDYKNKARHLKTIKHTNFINQTITI